MIFDIYIRDYSCFYNELRIIFVLIEIFNIINKAYLFSTRLYRL